MSSDGLTCGTTYPATIAGVVLGTIGTAFALTAIILVFVKASAAKAYAPASPGTQA